MLDDANIQEFINSNWGNICNIVYRNYRDLGRGLLGIKMTINKAQGNREGKMVYGTFKDNSQVGDEVLKMIAEYNPEEEFIIQYMNSTGKANTICIKSGENKTPKEIWSEMNEQTQK